MNKPTERAVINKMKIINLTPHTINVCGENGEPVLELAPSGQVARIETADTVSPELTAQLGLPVCTQQDWDPEGLPEPSEGTVFVVSLAVRTALPERRDLLSPGKLIRDKNGQPVGCLGLVVNG